MDEARYAYGYNLGWNERNEYIESFQDIFKDYNNQLRTIKGIVTKFQIEKARIEKDGNLTEEDLLEVYNNEYANSNKSFEQYKKDIESDYSKEVDNFNKIITDRFKDEYEANVYYMISVKEAAIRKLNAVKKDLEFKLKYAMTEYNRDTLGKDAYKQFLEIQKLRHAISAIDEKLSLLKITEEESKLALKGLNPRSKRIYESIILKKGKVSEETLENNDKDPIVLSEGNEPNLSTSSSEGDHSDGQEEEEQPELSTESSEIPPTPSGEDHSANQEEEEQPELSTESSEIPSTPSGEEHSTNPEEEEQPELSQEQTPQSQTRTSETEELEQELPKVKINNINKHKLSKLKRIVLIAGGVAALIAMPAIGVLLGSSFATGFGISAAYGGLSSVLGGTLGLSGVGLGATIFSKAKEKASELRNKKEMKQAELIEIRRYVDEMTRDIDKLNRENQNDREELERIVRRCNNRINLLKREIALKLSEQISDEKSLEVRAMEAVVTELTKRINLIENYITENLRTIENEQESVVENPEESILENSEDYVDAPFIDEEVQNEVPNLENSPESAPNTESTEGSEGAEEEEKEEAKESTPEPASSTEGTEGSEGAEEEEKEEAKESTPESAPNTESTEDSEGAEEEEKEEAKESTPEPAPSTESTEGSEGAEEEEEAKESNEKSENAPFIGDESIKTEFPNLEDLHIDFSEINVDEDEDVKGHRR